MLRTPKFWPREFHGLYSHKESDTTERLSLCSFPGGSVGKAATCNAGDLGSISGLRRSPEEGKGCPLQLSGLENSPVCIVHGVTKSQTRLSYFHSLSLSSLQSSTTLTFLHEFFQSLLVMFKDPIPKSSGNLRRP